jgi:hypothetical protein
MFEYFYHEIFRRTIIGFGTLFNNITIKRKDNDGDLLTEFKVPLAYGPTQKFLARLEQVPDLNKPVQFSLPRMSFEFVGLQYDTSRKLTQTQSFIAKSASNPNIPRKAYLPVPYSMDFELSIMTLTNDDMLQIIEQILPYFQPGFQITINLAGEIEEKRDIPIVLNNISMQDDYEGNYDTRRALIYTLRFTAKTYLFGPIQSAGVTNDIIKKVSVGFIAGDQSSSPTRDLTYTVEPVATKNYVGDVETTLSTNIDTVATSFEVESSSGLSVDAYITINEETMKIKSISGNTLKVARSQYNTVASDHVSGSSIYKITSADNEIIPFGDDFGFSGSTI